MSVVKEARGVCLHCGQPFEIAAPHDGLDRGGPKPGDLAICMECGGWTVYGPDGKDRKPNKEELKQIRATAFGREAEQVVALHNQRRTGHQTTFN